MDPWLEGSLWPSFQTQLCVEIARQLAPRLRPNYTARTPKRLIPAGEDAGESAALHAAPRVTVEVRDVPARRLVIAVEVVSPQDKRGVGHEAYHARRRRLLSEGAHLLEIDLLRDGDRVEVQAPFPPGSGFVFLSRAGDRPTTAVWTIGLRERLMTVPVPLLAPDADVALDLQQAMTKVYDGFGYDLEIDYWSMPEVPLKEDDLLCAEKRLRESRARLGKGPL